VSSPKLSPNPGSTQKKKRLGRGYGSGLGKTAGRGTKGHGARSGFTKRAWFEGGQMPLQRRVPKVGFKPLSRVEYQIVNLSTFAKLDPGAKVTPLEMASKGWIKDSGGLVKVLGDGDFTVKVELHAHAFSKGALEKISKAGGNAVVIPRFSPSSEGG
jgi:large subunit ribosomal protein L15